jgi:hypothetical protein
MHQKSPIITSIISVNPHYLEGTPYLATANNAFVLVVAKGALVTYPDQCGGTHIAVTNRAFPIAFIAKTADGNPGLLAAHDKITTGQVSSVTSWSRRWGLTDDGET